MQTSLLGLDELCYLTITSKWNITQDSYQAQASVYKNEASNNSQSI